MISLSKLLGVGCGDNSCRWGSRGGMGTNGGCRCGEEKITTPRDRAAVEQRHTLHQGIDMLRKLAELPSIEAALKDLARMLREGGR